VSEQIKFFLQMIIRIIIICFSFFHLEILIMKRLLVSALMTILITAPALAAETPLCALPSPDSKTTINNAAIEGDPDPGCAQMLASALKVVEKTAKPNIDLHNATTTPPQLSVGAVYLQPITMAPAGMMLPRDQSDIHLEIDIHAKQKLKSRGFAPGDWLPNAAVMYTIQKISSAKPLVCGKDKAKKPLVHCDLMPMVASDGAHYGDNVKLAGPGFYKVTFDARTVPSFGWHTDTESKILGTEFVNWQFKQSYLFAWTGIGKKGGY
jgi:uncharacterized protein involved in high-affinity Fe2+ transport